MALQQDLLNRFPISATKRFYCEFSSSDCYLFKKAMEKFSPEEIFLVSTSLRCQLPHIIESAGRLFSC